MIKIKINALMTNIHNICTAVCNESLTHRYWPVNVGKLFLLAPPRDVIIAHSDVISCLKIKLNTE